MKLFDMFLFRVECFINPRAVSKDFAPYVYSRDEDDLFVLSAHKKNNSLFSLIRWFDFIPEKYLVKNLEKHEVSYDDYYNLRVFLSRLGYLFNIDNRVRTDKDILIFYYVIQLVNLKNNCFFKKDNYINKLFTALCFELSIEYECYSRLSIKEGVLYFRKDNGKSESMNDLVALIYRFLDSCNPVISASKKFHQDAIDMLFKKDECAYTLDYNDSNLNFIYPDFFTETYRRSKRKVYQALSDCSSESQSGYNLLVSNFILMNYAFYCLGSNPGKINKLADYINDDVVFSRILSSIVYRGVGVDESTFRGTEYEKYIKFYNHEEIILYNIIYTVT